MRKRIQSMPDASFAILVAGMALAIGILARLPYLVADDLFPLGDGGLFVEMINSIKANRYLLPEYVEYNRLQIPFAYPPLGFYLAIAVSRVLGLPTLTVARYLPIVINLLTVVAFTAFSSQILKDRRTLFIGATIFPIVLHVYLWTIKGGGLARSPGFFFTTLALYFASAYENKRRRVDFVAGAFSLSGAILSHPEWALVAVASLAVLVWMKSREDWKWRIQRILALYIGAFIITAPWWGTVLYRFGITPLLMASQVAKTDLSQIVAEILEGRMFLARVTLLQSYFIPTLGLIGALVSLYRKDFFLPIWLMAAYLVSPKNAPIPGIIPLILLAAVGLRSVDDALSRGVEYLKSRQDAFKRLIESPVGALVFFSPSFVYLLIVIPLSLFNLINQPILRAIKQNDRAAMRFIAENTPQNARFVALAPQAWFEADSVEWFPLLADRQSLTTPQGLEWTSSSEFLAVCEDTYELSALVRQQQGSGNSDALVEYVERRFQEFEYVVIFANNVDKGVGGFFKTGRYELVYAKSGVLIFHRIPAPGK